MQQIPNSIILPRRTINWDNTLAPERRLGSATEVSFPCLLRIACRTVYRKGGKEGERKGGGRGGGVGGGIEGKLERKERGTRKRVSKRRLFGAELLTIAFVSSGYGGIEHTGYQPL